MGNELGLHVRAYEAGDAARCCEIIDACLDVMNGLNGPAREWVRAKNTQHLLDAELASLQTLVCELDGQLVGVGALDIPAQEIKRVYVDPYAHRQGAGRALMRHLEREARQRGISAVTVNASPNAVAFYRALGYQQARSESMRRGDAVFEFVTMLLQLD